MSVVMLQRAEEEKSARVSPRGVARVRFVPEKKNDPEKIVQKSGAELKTPRKRRKSRRLWFFHSPRVPKKKNGRREWERDREVPLGITVQQGHSSLCTPVTSSGWPYHKGDEFTDWFYQIFAVRISAILAATWQRTRGLEELSSRILLSGAWNVIFVYDVSYLWITVPRSARTYISFYSRKRNVITMTAHRRLI